MTKVINLRKEKYDVYIGRAGKGKDGFWGNPVAIGKVCPICGEIHTTGRETLPCYKRHLKQRMRNEEKFTQRLRELEGKTLGCFCKPKPCHGDVLIQAIEWLQSEDGRNRFPVE